MFIYIVMRTIYFEIGNVDLCRDYIQSVWTTPEEALWELAELCYTRGNGGKIADFSVEVWAVSTSAVEGFSAELYEQWAAESRAISRADDLNVRTPFKTKI